MREIKFRGKPTENNTSYIEEGAFVYGALIVCDNKYYIALNVNDNINRDDYEVYMIEVIPETVGQYTGLKDKNGKEIYEGDIVEFSYDIFTGNFDTKIGKGIVEFIQGAFYIKPFEIEGKKAKDIEDEEWFLLYSVNEDTLEVIGNIYDNPELLGGNNGD